MEKRMLWLWLLLAVAAMAREAVCSPPARQVKEAILKMASERIANGSEFHAKAVCVNTEVAFGGFNVRIIISVEGTDKEASISGQEVKRRVESEMAGHERFEAKYRGSQESGRPDVKIAAIHLGSPLAVIIRCITSRRLLDAETARQSMIGLMTAEGGILDEDVFGGGYVCLDKTISTHGFDISIVIVVEEHESAEIRGTEVKRRVLEFLSDSQEFHTMYNRHPHLSGTAMRTTLLPEGHDSPLHLVMYFYITLPSHS